ncbi:MAG: hypothetical protein Q9162_005364 [Coniocarpon cinnabarinum]
MLGRLRMSIQEAIEVYLRFGNEVFGNPRPLGLLPRYSASTFEKVLKSVLRGHYANEPGDGEEALMRQDDFSDEFERRCMTPKPDGHFDNTWLFRSYDHVHSYDENLGVLRNPGFVEFGVNPGVKIWEVARATTAAPTYFEEMKVGTHTYLDGGLGANNPAHLAYNNARQISKNAEHRLAVLISIGTGVRKSRSPFGRLPLLGNVLGVLGLARYNLTDTEQTHEYMKDIISASRGSQTLYQRFNVDVDLHDMQLDEWKRYRPSKRTLNQRESRVQQLDVGRELDDKPAIPNLLHSGASEDFKNILRDVKTVNRLQEATRKYLKRETTRPGTPTLPAVRPYIYKCAHKLVEQAKGRREDSDDRWRYFIGEHDNEILSQGSKTFKQTSPELNRNSTWNDNR